MNLATLAALVAATPLSGGVKNTDAFIERSDAFIRNTGRKRDSMGSKPCKCGARISANKETCLACSKAVAA